MRIKRGILSHKKHVKLLKSVKGFRMTKSRLTKVAKEAHLHAGQYAYAGRKQKKSNFRRLWITRISHAIKEYGISYNEFINKLKLAKIQVDRKIMAELILNDREAFTAIVDKAKKA
jgi:large subunit ribosomal protein L20